MNIVIPLAGKGSRFKKEGFTTPKVLIEIMGKPMFYWALESIKGLIKDYKFTFICLDYHLKNTNLEKKIYDFCPNATIVSLQDHTDGQTETVLKAKKYLQKEEQLLIFNGDTYQECSNITNKLFRSNNGKVFVFKSNDDSYSYVDVNSSNKINDIKEKKVISTYATTGLYFFPSTEQFISVAEELINFKSKTEGEYYISNVIKAMLLKGNLFESIEVEKCFTLGTPSEIKKFNLKRMEEKYV